jgi:hypothetical protein
MAHFEAEGKNVRLAATPWVFGGQCNQIGQNFVWVHFFGRWANIFKEKLPKDLGAEITFIRP